MPLAEAGLRMIHPAGLRMILEGRGQLTATASGG